MEKLNENNVNKFLKYLLIAGFFAVVSWISYKPVINLLYPVNPKLGEFVSERLIEIGNIDINEDDQSGYKNIADAIGDSRVVFLGEQDHGDAPTFLAKTKLIKYLHENLDFDVLIFESDFFSLNYALQGDSTASESESDFTKNIYSIWSNSNEVQDLYSYIKSTTGSENELIVSGADPRHVMPISRKYLATELIKHLKSKEHLKSDTLSVKVESYLSDFIKYEYDSIFIKNDHEWFFNVLNDMEEGLPDSLFLKQELKNIRGAVKNSISLTGNNIRDTQMAENLKWLLDFPFKNKKVMFWGANSHIFRKYHFIKDVYKGSTSQDTINMGSISSDDLKDDLYILGFTSSNGIAGRLNTPSYEVSPTKPNQIEYFMEKKAFDYAFLDFRNTYEKDSLNGIFWSKAIGHTPMLSNWAQMFDGLFFIDTMYPCSEVN